MKKIVKVVVSAMLCFLYFSIISFATELENEGTVVFSGLGTQESPYLIENSEDIENLADLVNSGNTDYASSCYKVVADIIMSGVNHAPIGTEDFPFSGVFDGGKFVISDIDINSEQKYSGFFGVTKNAKLMNIIIKDAVVFVQSEQTAYAGVLAGLVTVADEDDIFSITGCSVDGSVSVTASVSGFAAGITAKADVKHGLLIISDCHSNLSISTEANTIASAAGIAASLTAKNNGFVSVTNSIVEGYVEAISNNYESYAAGVVGMANQQDGNWSDFVPTQTQNPEESSILESTTLYSFDNCVVDCQLYSTGKTKENISCLAAHVSEYVVVGTNYVSSETNIPTSINGVGCDTYKTRSKLFSKSYLTETVGLDFVSVWVSVFNKPQMRTATPYIATKIDTDNKLYAQLVGFDGAELYAAAYVSGTERMVGALYFPYAVFGYEPQEITFNDVDYGKIKLFALGDSLNPLCECIEI